MVYAQVYVDDAIFTLVTVTWLLAFSRFLRFSLNASCVFNHGWEMCFVKLFEPIFVESSLRSSSEGIHLNSSCSGPFSIPIEGDLMKNFLNFSQTTRRKWLRAVVLDPFYERFSLNEKLHRHSMLIPESQFHPIQSLRELLNWNSEMCELQGPGSALN